jgi:hypothetical protein
VSSEELAKERKVSPQRVGLLMLASSGLLASIATAASLVTGPGGSPGVPNYPYLTGPSELIVEDLVLISGLMFCLGAALVWNRWLRLVIGTSIGALGLGGLLFVLTSENPVLVTNSDGTILHVIPYPQTVFLIVWPVIVLVVSPLAGWIRRKLIINRESDPMNRRASDPVPELVQV